MVIIRTTAFKGDIVEKVVIGNAELYLGDCLKIMPTLGRIDAVITDPPYGLGKKLAGGTWGVNNAWDQEAKQEWADMILSLAEKVIIWGGNYYSLPPSRGWLAWYKPDSPPSMGDFELAWTSLDKNTRHIIWSIAATNAERVGHPTQKPVRVMQESILQADCPEIVLDPFMGSGTTGVACMNMSRNFIGIEINSEYFDLACKRIEQAQQQLHLGL